MSKFLHITVIYYFKKSIKFDFYGEWSNYFAYSFGYCIIHNLSFMQFQTMSGFLQYIYTSEIIVVH